MPRTSLTGGILLALSLGACDRPGGLGSSPGKDTAVVFIAASLTNAIRPQLDSFAAAQGVTVLTESGASMEHVRKLTELHRIPDLLLLADDDVFPKHLAPNYTSWWADFARNRMVVAYTDRSKLHDSINANNWYRILTRKGVEVGRSDPKIAPVGYRALAVFTLAEFRYREPGLARRLLDNAPLKNVRGNAADLAALLAAGEIDYIYDYESVARANGFHFVQLPDEVTGKPVTYALSIPTAAPHPHAASAVLEFILSDSVRQHLRAAHIDMFDAPVVNGSGAPASLSRPRR
jgi:molybdate/tungstate transport system substrate-binding protein